MEGWQEISLKELEEGELYIVETTDGWKGYARPKNNEFVSTAIYKGSDNENFREEPKPMRIFSFDKVKAIYKKEI